MTLKNFLNGRFFYMVLLAAAFAIMVLALIDFGGDLPKRADLQRRSHPPDVTEAVKRMENLFVEESVVALRLETNRVSPFHTAHFQPAPPPTNKTVKPVVAPPKTKKITLLYQGVYQTAAGEKKAFIKVGDQLLVGSPGDKVIADWLIGEVALRTLVLKNAAAETNVLQFNEAKEVEIPVE